MKLDKSGRIEAPAKSQKIFLVRHAKPELPHNGRLYYGRTDYPLSQEGIERAKALRSDLKNTNFSRIYCSDLERARHTAELLLPDRTDEIIVTESLREISLGEWEGRSFDEVRKNWTEIYEKRGRSFSTVAPHGGETFVELQERAVPAFLKILDESPSGDILIVAHAALIWSIMCRCFSFDLNDLFYYPMDYCGLHFLHNSNGLIRMIRYNWNARLTEAKLF